MAITLDGTTGITTPDLTSTDDITANSATVLTSASNIPAANITGSLPAIDGSALTGVGGSTDYGAVGTHVIALTSGTSATAGTTIAGSSLYTVSISTASSLNMAGVPLTNPSPAVSLGLSGTWRTLTNSSRGGFGTAFYMSNLWVRIS